MYCQNCGKEVKDSDAYCYHCGTVLKKHITSDGIPHDENTGEQPSIHDRVNKITSKKSFRSKRIVAVLATLFLIAAIPLIGKMINSQSTADEYPDQKIDWEDQEAQQQNVDLSAYDDHGEWSNGIMWVHKSEGGYDYVKGSFAYIDSTGDILGQWHSDEEWICPLDFNGDRALVYVGSKLDDTPMIDWGHYEKAYYYVVDNQGQERYSFVTFINPGYIAANGSSNTQLHEFDENGYLFYEVCIDTYGYIDADDPNTWTTTHLLVPDENSFVRDIVFEKFTGHSYNGKRVAYVYEIDRFANKYQNGYITYLHTFSQNGHTYQYCLCFDSDGNIVLDVTSNMDGYTIREIPIITDDGNLEIVFSGKDGNAYEVLMDIKGDWLTDPTQIP